MERNIILDENGSEQIIQHPLLCSHNTFTYLRPRKIWHYICIPFARCQNKGLIKQIEEGIQVFDIRVRFDNSGYLILCHGLFELKLEIPVIEYELSGINTRYVLSEKYKFPNFIDWLLNIVNIYIPNNEQVYFRLILETSKEDIVQELFFINFCRYFHNITEKQKNLNIIGCNRKFDWKKLYNTLEPEPNIFQHISSYPNYKESIKPRWYEKICPWLYAKRTNSIYKHNFNMGMYKNYDIVSYDFV